MIPSGISPSRIIRRASSVIVIASFLAATTARAQGGGYGPTGGYGPGGGTTGGGGWGGGGGRGRGMGGHSFDPDDIPTPEEVDGPPSPATMRQLLSLSDSQTQRYTSTWDSLMNGTGAQRDSARTARDSMQAAFRNRDRQAVQNQAKVLTALGKELRKRNDAFDKSLTFLSKDQRKQYEDYEKQQKQAAEEERRQRFRERSGSGSPPESS